MLNGLKQRFDLARADTHRIGREYLLLDRKKVIPVDVFHEAITDEALPSHLHSAMFYGFALAARKEQQKLRTGEARLFFSDTARMPDPLYKIVLDASERGLKRIESNKFSRMSPEYMAATRQLHADIASKHRAVTCRTLGDMLDDFEEGLFDPQFRRSTAISVWFGQGAEVRRVWQKLTGLPDWRPYAEEWTDSAPRKRRRKKRKFALPPLWQPQGHTI